MISQNEDIIPQLWMILRIGLKKSRPEGRLLMFLATPYSVGSGKVYWAKND
jgi:hypothetical protein